MVMRWIGLGLAGWLTCMGTGWAITPDAVSVGSIEGNVTLDVTHTATGTGTDGLMACGIATSTGGGTTVSSVVWDPAGVNQAFTQVGTIHLTDVRTDLWYLKAPTAGSAKPIRITTSAGVNHAAWCATWTGVDQTTPLGTVVSTSGTASPISQTPGSAVGDLVIDVAAWSSNAVTETIGASQTQIGTKQTTTTGGQLSVVGSSEPGAAGTTTMSWTFPGTINWGHIAVALKAVAADTPAHLRGGSVPGMNSLGLGGPLP